MNNFKYTSENEIKFQEYVSRYPKIDSCMLPALWLVQEQEGWVSPEAMVYVADRLGKTPIQVYEVATFYTMFNLKPIGKYHIELCKTVSCMVCGAKELKQYIKDVLGLESGQTSPDGLFTFTEVECQGACGDAPMIALNNVYHGKLTKEKLEKIIWECKNAN
ncbi:complex I 24 kDa subunit family protein [Aliarcobacter butzleri]|uniref:complex I 24 kDa subunit family protein n=1 Tax=Aliarcobacter butzleri TaxID=28197 RepID=UPI00189FBCCD|nr:NAD(P)H-dependent oxidoreductase subunit E [Aliarcobacter butzleri]MBF7069943.1 NAD(P)H-dependent oxidoreductase subunit E [Aliarcobacter butzleri]